VIQIDKAMLEAAILGGGVLGGGGGSSMEEGRSLGRAALERGKLQLAEISEIPEEALLVTCAAVGAPSSQEAFTLPDDHARAVELLCEMGHITLGGLIANECGGGATINGWYQAAALGLPLVDAPCNGRAHPTGVMGSMGLHNLHNYVSLQTAVGGNPQTSKHVEVFLRGSLEGVASLVRQASVTAGGMVCVARNPVPASYVRQNGAAGAIKMCIELGAAMQAERNRGSEAVGQRAADFLKGKIVTRGKVSGLTLNMSGGFDTGKFEIGNCALTFWNEYMTLDCGNQRLATFPDLIMTLDAESGNPVTSAQIAKGQDILILAAPRSSLILAAGMRDPVLLLPAERAVGKKLITS
jgi:uncharacterized protein